MARSPFAAFDRARSIAQGRRRRAEAADRRRAEDSARLTRQIIERNRPVTAIERARRAAQRLAAIPQEIRTAANGLQATRDRHAREIEDDRRIGRPPRPARDRALEIEAAQASYESALRAAHAARAEAQAELASALAEVQASSGDHFAQARQVAAWRRVERQLDAGAEFGDVLADAVHRQDVDTLQALREEWGAYAMANAGANKDARAQVEAERATAERRVDHALGRLLPAGVAKEAAQLRVSSTAADDLADSLLTSLAPTVHRGEITPKARLAVAYAVNEHDRETGQKSTAGTPWRGEPAPGGVYLPGGSANWTGGDTSQPAPVGEPASAGAEVA